MGAYLAWYRSVDDKAPYLKAATDLYDLVQALPHHPRDRTHAMALQHARQIRSFYTAFSLPADQVLTYRDARAAENLRWWQHFSGDRVIYWAAAAHTTTTPQVSINVEDYPATSFTPVGAYLERWYGRRYIAVGYTFNAGTMFLPPAQQVALPPAPPEWFEAPLAEVGMRSFFLDVSARMPAPVQNWLAQPTLTRGVPEAGTTSTMTGGTPRQWFDALVHTQHVSASTPLAPSPR
jgi:erythromycin esterase